MKCKLLVLSELVIVFCLIGQGVQFKLIVSTRGKITEVNLQTKAVTHLLTNLGSEINSMDYDYKNGYIYFPRYSKNDILRFRYPSNYTYQTENVTIANNPIGIAIDPLYNHVYWIERYTGKLYQCNMDGSNQFLILQDDPMFALTLDIANRWVYYSIIDTTNNVIRRARLNGTEIKTFTDVHTQTVSGLSIDSNEGHIYWMEYITGDLMSSNINGTAVKQVFMTSTTNTNRGIHAYNSIIYCSNGNQVQKVTVSSVVTANVIYTDKEQIYGVFIYNENTFNKQKMQRSPVRMDATDKRELQ
ncbi:low-density lipoprotein receptor-like isoform X1 [Mytilus californianus]|uniref:low-density lipoprotein receptor-like isoform X1 n=1 Tax=Mytilus californianus TaxID=6549 RepID=UPI002246571D|nr:low-density lipoprotein receptor-like isoform X1 [Mytilus californianus]XP_052081030.1 low-density lipoprotein receptor-like isoform X1 [Mytilus californianus]XP_052081031.1 low-density lipoprotein receptor-like isoform X1 [Mytilus californianus]